MMSTTGIVIFKSHCLCSNSQNVSLYVKPETCEDDFHKKHATEESNSGCCDVHHHHHETAEHQCSDCSDHMDGCGCAYINVNVVKLKDQFNEEIRFSISTPVVLTIFENDLSYLLNSFSDSEEQEEHYIDPPPKIASSLDFLIQIHQLKIPSIA